MKVTTFVNHGQIFQLVRDDNQIRFTTIRGEAADFLDFLLCLNQAGVLKEVLLEHYSRENRKYEFTTRRGMSGCRDYYVRWQVDKGFIHKKRILHISMNSKLNEGIDIWAGDLQQLLFQDTGLAYFLPEVCASPVKFNMYTEEEIQFNLERPAFDVPSRNWLYNLKEDGEKTIEGFPICQAFWKIVGGKEGYDAFFKHDDPDDEEEEA